MPILHLLDPSEGERGEFIPNQWYITERISSAVKDLLWYDLHDLIASTDVGRVDVISRGPLQDDPQGVYIEIFENDLVNPDGWAHGPDAIIEAPPGRVMTFPGGRMSGRVPPARETMGGEGRSFEYQRALTLRISVWLDEMPLVVVAGTERATLDRISGLVAGRVRVSLLEGGYGIGAGQPIEDSFGEYTVLGPFFGEEWIEKQTGEAHISTRYIQAWWRTTIEGG